MLVSVRISRDSLSGNEHAKPYGRVAIPISDVRKMETQEVNPLSIVAVVMLAVGTLIALGAFVPRSECVCAPSP